MKVGDRVAYSVQFLRSIGMSHSEAARGRGTIRAIEGQQPQAVAVVVWADGQDLPTRILLTNLAPVGPNLRFCQG